MPKRGHTEEQIVATGGNRSACGGGLSQGGDQRGDLLSLEAAVFAWTALVLHL